MPESPEVQVLAEYLDARLAGRTLSDADILEFRVTKTRARPVDSLRGQTVTGVARIGKHLDVAFEDAHLVVSLGRNGWVREQSVRATDDAPEADAPPALAALTFDSGPILELTDAGNWVSLGLHVVDDVTDVAAVAKLGPDPADSSFSESDFERALGTRRKQIKAILQEQESMAGVGNAYSDEILHVARLSPVTHAAALGADERSTLFEATTTTLRNAIAARRGTGIAQLKAAKVAAMRVHGRAGETCPVCGDTVRDLAFGGTTAQYCPTCQTGGVLL